MITLAQLRPGQSAKVIEVETLNSRAQRLLAIGLLPGTTIVLEQIAPLGDPIAISISGHRFILRKSEARLVRLELPPLTPETT